MESVSGVHEFFLQTGEANGAEKVMQSKYTANSGREIESEQEGRGDRRGRVSNTKSLFAHTLYARVSIFIALPIVCSASFSRFSKIRQHLAATRLRYSELFKRPGPISINAVRTIPDLSTVYGQSSSLLCARQKKSQLRNKQLNLARSDLLHAMIHGEQCPVASVCVCSDSVCFLWIEANNLVG